MSGTPNMELHDFVFVLSSVRAIDTPMMNALFEAGCGDCTPGAIDGVVYLDFGRESTSREAAIQTATADVRKALPGVDITVTDWDTIEATRGTCAAAIRK